VPNTPADPHAMVNAPLVSQSQCLVLFARAPTPGQVKKRLIPDLNSGPACELYRAFVDDILDRFRGSREFCVRMAVAGDEPLRLPASWKRVPLFVQQGNALGKRLAHAFRVLFAEGFERVVIIGTDAPTLSADFVREAFESSNARMLSSARRWTEGIISSGCTLMFDGMTMHRCGRRSARDGHLSVRISNGGVRRFLPRP